MSIMPIQYVVHVIDSTLVLKVTDYCKGAKEYVWNHSDCTIMPYVPVDRLQGLLKKWLEELADGKNDWALQTAVHDLEQVLQDVEKL